MQGVGPGSLLGGRYALRDRLMQHSRWERWSATDTDLGLDVVLLCFPPTAPEAEAALDAARRAAAVEDPRLTRLLDVGRNATVCFVVEEATPGAAPLTSLVEDGGLAAQEVRRIVGEAARGLATASARGLHHGVLTPRDVLVQRNGLVTVRGLATQAALLGEEDRSADQASRADAVALAGLLYAGLTGRWPLAGPESGLEPAPRLPSGVVAPSQIVAAVPADIDSLVSRTLHGEGAPATPDEVADALFPGTARVRATRPSSASGRPSSPRPRTRPVPHDAARRDHSGTWAPPGAGPPPPPDEELPPSEHEAAPSGAMAGRDPALVTAAEDPTGEKAVPSSGSSAPATHEDPAAPGHREEPAATIATEQLAGPPRTGDEAAGQSSGLPASTASAVVASASASAKTAAERLRSDLGRVGASASTIVGQVATVTKTTAGRVTERASARAAAKRHEEPPTPPVHGQDAHLADVLEETEEALEPPVPRAFAPDLDSVPDREQSRLALAIVAGFVVVAALLGIWGLPSLGGAPSAAPVVRTPTPGPETTTEGGTPTGDSAPTTALPSLGEPTPVPIVRAAGFEPTNGGQVANGTATRAYDGKPETSWQSKWFATENFGGLPIEGIGLLADLGQATDVRRVTLRLPVQQTGTVYVADEDSLDGARPLGSFTDQEGTVVLDAPSGTPVNGRLVIVYVTGLGPDGPSRYRAQVSEMQVSG